MHTLRCFCLSLALVAFTLSASSMTASAAPESKDQKGWLINALAKRRSTSARPTVALALGGGGMRGAAHIGVLKALEQAGIPIDYIVGSSIGSVVGGLYCAGVPLEKIAESGRNGSMYEAYMPRYVALKLALRPLAKLTYLFHKAPSGGLTSGKRFERFLERLLPTGVETTDDLPIPFACVAARLTDGKACLLTKGKLTNLIRASSSIPILVCPVEIDGHLYTDGGIRNNLPCAQARRTGADIVIAVSVDEDLEKLPPERFTSLRQIFGRVVDAALVEPDELKARYADIIIRPKLAGIPILSKKASCIASAIKAGEEATRQVLPTIRKMMSRQAASKVAAVLERQPDILVAPTASIPGYKGSISGH